MLEHLPAVVGRNLRRVRPGLAQLTFYRPELATTPCSLTVRSPAFRGYDPIPARFTVDGSGTSPPLVWFGVPDGTRSLAMIVEDADSPTPAPMVHAIVADLPPVLSRLDDGELVDHAGGPRLGRNSYLRAGWLPPDPPPGHGSHRYAFQLFALAAEPELVEHPGRRALVEALARHTIARGMLVGTYAR
jgi:Raf kinase inhibitor-like YbhB/YbcL family protein